MIDILEQELADINIELLDILLMDRTTRKNICWATDNYISRGPFYGPKEPITSNLIVGKNTRVLQPRVSKSISEQSKRTKEKAEVFTPSWVCNKQNNLIDEAWFGRKDVFNMEEDETWLSTKNKISFPADKTWHHYVNAKRLEISCGEAPYLVSRYDTVSGKEIPINERIGLLDRKLRIVNENTEDKSDWFRWATRAFESTYGYEYQGDNLLIARENLLFTLIEYTIYKFGHEPSEDQLKKIAKIISWNIWQMDGITMAVPFKEKSRLGTNITIFEWGGEVEYKDTEPIPCKIYDWRSNESLEFRDMLKGDK